MPPKKSTAPRGVSCDLLKQFLSQTLKDKSITTTQALTKIVLPATKKDKCAYYSLFENKKDSKGNSLVGAANIFVSHAWRYKLSDLISTCLEYAETEQKINPKKNLYFWIDLFINNQNTATSKDQSWWSNIFKNTIGKIGHTLLVLSPWNNPIPFTRAWCLWEILCTVQEKAVLSVGMSSQEYDSFLAAIKDDFRTILTDFSNIQSKKAEASREDDKTMIFQQIQTTMSFHQLDSLVKDQMRAWLYKNAEKVVKSSQDETMSTANLLVQVGSWYSQVGKLEDAESVFAKAEKIYEKIDDSAPAKATALASMKNNQGFMYQELDQLEKSLQLYNEAITLISPANPDSLEIASIYNNIGSIYSKLGQQEKALEYYEKDLTIKQKSQSTEKYSLATTFNNLSMHKLNIAGDISGARELCDKAIKLVIECYGDDHHGLGKIYENSGTIYLSGGANEQAITHLEKSIEINRTNLGPDHPNVGSAKTTLGLALKKCGKQEESLKHYLEAEAILSKMSQFDSTVSTLYSNISTLYGEMGEMEKSVNYRLKDLEICEHNSHKGISGKRDLLCCLNNLAATYFRAENYTEAIKYFRRTLTAAENLYGKDSEEYLQSRDDLEIAESYLEDK